MQRNEDIMVHDDRSEQAALSAMLLPPTLDFTSVEDLDMPLGYGYTSEEPDTDDIPRNHHMW